MAKEGKKNGFRFVSNVLKPGTESSDVYNLQVLLARYGYLPGGFRPGRYDEHTRQAVAQFQSFYRIYPDEDGLCDAVTTKLLAQPRCGLPDNPPTQRSVTGRLAPFVTVGAKWDQPELRFRFINATPDLPEDRQRAIIGESFGRWAKVCALRFREAEIHESAELSVAFHHGSHGDGNPFDDSGGPDGNTLAHAFFPPPAGGTWAGSLHFDEFETWKDQPGGAGTRLYNVSLHEIGHLLGLRHSQDTAAIMYAYYAEDRNDLRADDIAGMQSLYGPPSTDPILISPGKKVTGHLPHTDAEVHYQVTLSRKLIVKLDGPQAEDFDLFIRHGAPAGSQAGEYDQVSWGITSDESIAVENPKPGTYYILVRSYRGKGDYSLQVDVV